MIKKLNKKRVKRHRPLGKWYLDKGTTDYSRIFMQLLDIEFELRELKEQIWIYILRLRHAIKKYRIIPNKNRVKISGKNSFATYSQHRKITKRK